MSNIASQMITNCFFKKGYRFSPDFVGLLMRKFNRHNGKMAFDDFIQCCVAVQVSIVIL